MYPHRKTFGSTGIICQGLLTNLKKEKLSQPGHVEGRQTQQCNQTNFGDSIGCVTKFAAVGHGVYIYMAFHLFTTIQLLWNINRIHRFLV